MRRTITGFHRDDEGSWVAELSCLHNQHVRHQPPFRLAPWVLSDAERQARTGSPLDCPLCDRAELPEGLHVVRTTPVWTAETIPAGLRRAHRVAAGLWGRLRVEGGEVRFRAATVPPIDTVVRTGSAQPIPPEVDHDVEPGPDARLFVEFLGRAPAGGAGT